MIVDTFKGYIEGRDVTKVPMNYLTYPTKNVIIFKETAFTRPGIENDGNPHTSTEKRVIGEYVWKDALGGEKALRALKGGDIQVKYLGVWIKIGAVDANATHVRFATWIDSSGAIIKKRLFFVDGTDSVYEWNGALGVIASANAGAQTITVGGSGTLERMGFDPGTTTAQPVQVIRFTSPGVIAGTDAYTTDSAMDTLVVHTVGAISNVPAADDIVVGSVVEHTDVLAGINKDDVYTYKNRLALASLDSIRVYFSDVEAKLDYTVPAVADRVAISPFFVDLAGNYTAMISRFNQSSQETILWISDVDGWTKVTALVDQDSFGNWVKSDRVSETERIGALPFCVADYKGDIIFFAQDRTVQRVQSIDVLGRDQLQLISDDVQGFLERVDVTDARIYYLSRYVLIVLPANSLIAMLDMIEEHWLPPQTIGASCLSVIEGVQYGHSNARDETFYLFKGRNDLGADIESIFASPYYQGDGRSANTFRPKAHTLIGVSGRTTESAKTTVKQLYNADGYQATDHFVMDGSKMTLHSVPNDYSWGSQVWGIAPLGGPDEGSNPVKRFFAFSTYDAVSWLEWAVMFTVNGADQEFHLLGFYINESSADTKIDQALFIDRPTP
jgi:hypothetical protein